MAGKDKKVIGAITKTYPTEFFVGTTGNIIADLYKFYSGLDWWEKLSKGGKGILSLFAGGAGVTLFWTVPSVETIFTDAILAFTAGSVVTLPELAILALGTVAAWSFFARVTRSIVGEIANIATKGMFRVKDPNYYITKRERNKLIEDYLEIPGNENKERAEAGVEVDAVIKKFLDALNDSSKKDTHGVWQRYFKMLKKGEYEAYQSAMVVVEGMKRFRKEAKIEKQELEKELDEVNSELQALRKMRATDEVVIDLPAADAPHVDELSEPEESNPSIMQRFTTWVGSFRGQPKPEDRDLEMGNMGSIRRDSVDEHSVPEHEDPRDRRSPQPVVVAAEVAKHKTLVNPELGELAIAVSSDASDASDDEFPVPPPSESQDHRNSEDDKGGELLETLADMVLDREKKEKAPKKESPQPVDTDEESDEILSDADLGYDAEPEAPAKVKDHKVKKGGKDKKGSKNKKAEDEKADAKESVKDENNKVLSMLNTTVGTVTRRKKRKRPRKNHRASEILPLFMQQIEHSKSTRRHCHELRTKGMTRQEVEQKISKLEKEKKNLVSNIQAREHLRNRFKL